MDYKEQILEIIRNTDDERILGCIFWFISGILNGKKSSR